MHQSDHLKDNGVAVTMSPLDNICRSDTLEQRSLLLRYMAAPTSAELWTKERLI